MNVLLFAFLLAPLWSQYKFLLLGVFAFGIVGGIAFRTLHERAWPVALVVLSLFLLPFALDCVHKARDWNDAPRVFSEAGIALEHRDPAERDLYRWMRTSTHPRAVFVDTDLGLPVYGQRALYVALPEQAELEALSLDRVPTPGDGYTLDPRIFLKDVDGYPGDLVDRRQQVAARLLSGAEPDRGRSRRRRRLPGPRPTSSCGQGRPTPLGLGGRPFPSSSRTRPPRWSSCATERRRQRRLSAVIAGPDS